MICGIIISAKPAATTGSAFRSVTFCWVPRGDVYESQRRKSSSRKCGDKTDLGIFNFLRSIFEENWRGGRGWVAVGGMAELHMESERESNSSIPFIHSFFRLTDGTPTLSILPSIPRTLSNRSRGNFSSYPQPKSVCISS